MQSMQDASQPAAGCHSLAAEHANLEARGLTRMPPMPEGHAPPVCLIKLTEAREIIPYKVGTPVRGAVGNLAQHYGCGSGIRGEK